MLPACITTNKNLIHDIETIDNDYVHTKCGVTAPCAPKYLLLGRLQFLSYKGAQLSLMSKTPQNP